MIIFSCKNFQYKYIYFFFSCIIFLENILGLHQKKSDFEHLKTLKQTLKTKTQNFLMKADFFLQIFPFTQEAIFPPKIHFNGKFLTISNIIFIDYSVLNARFNASVRYLSQD